MFWNKNDKGIAFVNSERCDGCGKCMKICKHHVLEMVATEKAERVIACNTRQCAGCGKCVVICPQRAIEIIF